MVKKVQKTIYGYKYSAIKKRIKIVTCLNGKEKRIITLRKGMFLVDFNIDKITDNYVILSDGFKTKFIKIIK